MLSKITALLFSLLISAAICLPAFAAEIPRTGTSAPLFKLPDQNGKEVSLDQFRGKWVVLYFYPKDFTSGCSVEAHNFQEDLQKYASRNAVIVGVSADSVASHEDFATQDNLKFTLLSDTDHSVSAMYGSVMTHLLLTLSARNTFLIDPSGVIRKVYQGVSPPKHSEEVLNDLERLQSESAKNSK